jgi:D-alanyl-D-alanine carboxypeptidase
MGITGRIGIFLVLSFSILLNMTLTRTGSMTSAEIPTAGNAATSISASRSGKPLRVTDDLQLPCPESAWPGSRYAGHVKATTVYYSERDLDLFDGTGSIRKRILVIPRGAHLLSRQQSQGWIQVAYAGMEGWVKESLVESSVVDMVDGIIIANKGFDLPKDFSPGRNPDAYASFLRMKQDAAKLGIILKLSTTYRSYSAQQHIYRTFENRVGTKRADNYSARAGYSEHQTGLAFDIGGADPDFRLKQALGTMKEGIWMAENAPSYGFILRYPKGRENMTGYMYEPWHFRYVGTEAALRITASGLSLDEYLGVIAPEYAPTP